MAFIFPVRACMNTYPLCDASDIASVQEAGLVYRHDEDRLTLNMLGRKATVGQAPG
jgi:hypothetical protein